MTTEEKKRPKSEVIPKTRTKKIIGNLSEDELKGLKIAIKAVNDMRAEVATRQRQLNTMEAGYNSIITDFQKKYNLPEQYSVDLETGKLGKQGVF